MPGSRRKQAQESFGKAFALAKETGHRLGHGADGDPGLDLAEWRAALPHKRKAAPGASRWKRRPAHEKKAARQKGAAALPAPAPSLKYDYDPSWAQYADGWAAAADGQRSAAPWAISGPRSSQQRRAMGSWSRWNRPGDSIESMSVWVLAARSSSGCSR